MGGEAEPPLVAAVELAAVGAPEVSSAAAVAVDGTVAVDRIVKGRPLRWPSQDRLHDPQKR